LRYFKGMKHAFHLAALSALLFVGLLGRTTAVAAEGDVGTAAYSFTGLSDLATVPTTYDLAQYQGKVVLLVVFQWDCGGCVANAPKFGRLVDTLDRGPDSAKFQAIGAEIRTANYTQIQSYRNSLTNSGALTVNFPLVKVPYDSGISGKGVTGDPTDATGTKWKRYNSYRDVYFVINHAGIITARIAGNRINAMTTVKYDSLRLALNAALAAVPVSVQPSMAQAGNSLRIFQRGNGYLFDLGGLQVPVSLKILDLQGRNVRTLTSARPGSVAWDGKDASGKAVPFGTYFIRVSDGKTSFSQRLNVLP
jgi:hypothetical protein